MKYESQTKLFEQRLNSEILPLVRFDILQESYETSEMVYARTIFKKMQGLFGAIFGTYEFARTDDDLPVPAVFKHQEKGNLCIGILDIALSNPQYYCCTFFSENGIIQEGNQDNKEMRRFLPCDFYCSLKIPSLEIDVPPIIDELFGITAAKNGYPELQNVINR